MAAEKEQLAKDFEEVQGLLAQYPDINVLQTEGEPPGNYDIEYHVKGFVRDADGNVRQASQHLLRINLPFGYPHFPPIVKPLTPLFHPDIDPDAVRITSYWQQNPSLARLILHLGEMICGKEYNTEEPFNQRAADWYIEHAADLPLDEIRKREAGAADEEVGLSLEMDSDGHSNGLDSLAMEIDTPQEDAPTPAQLDEVRAHIDRNEVVTAGKLLADLPASSPEVQNLQEIVSSALNERDRLIRELEELEDEDRFTDAYELFEKVQEIAPDTPALSDIGHRLRQSQAMLETFSLSSGSEEDSAEQPADQEQSAPASKKKTKKQQQKSVNQGEEKKYRTKPPVRTRIRQKAQIKVPVKPVLVALALLALICGAVFLHTKDMNTLMKAQRDWIEVKYQRCQTKEQFREKRIKAEKILVGLKSIITPGIGKKELQQEILDQLNSPEFKAGESGQAEAAELQKKVESLIEEAKALAEKDQFAEAASTCNEALSLAEERKLEQYVVKIKQLLEQIQELRNQESAQREQEQVGKSGREAAEFFRQLDKEDSAADASNKRVAAARWQEAADQLQRALELLDAHPEISLPDRRRELQHMLAYSILYQQLAHARQVYYTGDFKEAINDYRKALVLLDEQQAGFSSIYNNAVASIRQAIIMLEISIELRSAIEAESRDDLKKSLAKYKGILKIISSSRVAKDDNLIGIKKYIRKKIKEQSLKEAKNSTQEWLKKNYEAIFRRAYPSTKSSELSRPQITFIRVMNGHLLYTISCAERKRGSVYQLELNYQYNPATGGWSRYQGEL